MSSWHHPSHTGYPSQTSIPMIVTSRQTIIPTIVTSCQTSITMIVTSHQTSIPTIVTSHQTHIPMIVTSLYRCETPAPVLYIALVSQLGEEKGSCVTQCLWSCCCCQVRRQTSTHLTLIDASPYQDLDELNANVLNWKLKVLLVIHQRPCS